MKTFTYREGTWFAVPLRDGSGYGLGVVARKAPSEKIMLAYFFGPRRSVLPGIADVSKLQPSDAIKCLRVGDLGLLNGGWPIIGNSEDWNREVWGVPPFIRKEDLSKRAWRVIYSQSDPSKVEREESVPYEIDGNERDALHGYGAVELLLTKLLAA